MKKIIVIFLLFSMKANAWGGYDWKRHSFIEIEKENLVREEDQIEFYEHGKGYAIKQNDSSIENNGTDSYGMKRTFEMD